jgi:hypothetical protein
METSEKSQESSLDTPISLQEDSPVRISVLQDYDEEYRREVEAAFGLSTQGLLGTFDQDSYSLKMSQVCLLTNQCDEYLETFPRSGSMRNGKVYQRRPLVRLTRGTEFGYLPTPEKSIGMKTGGNLQRGNAQTCFQKEIDGTRPSGAKIGSSLKWSKEYIGEWLRTGGYVNPAWLEALMGFPEKWWIVPMEPSATPSSLKSPSGSVSE